MFLMLLSLIQVTRQDGQEGGGGHNNSSSSSSSNNSSNMFTLTNREAPVVTSPSANARADVRLKVEEEDG